MDKIMGWLAIGLAVIAIPFVIIGYRKLRKGECPICHGLGATSFTDDGEPIDLCVVCGTTGSIANLKAEKEKK